MWQWLQARLIRTRKIDECLDAIVRESADYIVPLTILQAGQRLCWRLAAEQGIILTIDEACRLVDKRLQKRRKW